LGQISIRNSSGDENPGLVTSEGATILPSNPSECEAFHIGYWWATLFTGAVRQPGMPMFAQIRGILRDLASCPRSRHRALEPARGIPSIRVAATLLGSIITFMSERRSEK